MRISMALVAGAFVLPAVAWGQGRPATLAARSSVVTIVDGVHVKKNIWQVMPERVPDVYYVELPLHPHVVTFTTDRGSLSFPVTYGSRHQFVIQLEDGREALTEVRAEFRNLLSPVRPTGGTGVIPFTLGDNDKIYVKGRYNDGELLDLQLDLGAGGSLIKKASVPKVRMNFDSSITLRNSDGVKQVPSSSSNRLEIAGFRWTRVDVAVADNMTHREDGIVGNALFRDKVLEIDHDRMVIVVHDELPALSGEWAREEIFLDGGTVPFVRGKLQVGQSSRDGWFMLDTGAYTSILSDPKLKTLGRMGREFRHLLGPLGGRPAGPSLSLVGRAFSEFNYSVRPYDGAEEMLGLLGNDILKRFNLVLDNRQGAVYLKPNARSSDRFRNPERTFARLVVVGTAVAIAATLVWKLKR
jgi:hypothetical protein